MIPRKQLPYCASEGRRAPACKAWRLRSGQAHQVSKQEEGGVGKPGGFNNTKFRTGRGGLLFRNDILDRPTIRKSFGPPDLRWSVAPDLFKSPHSLRSVPVRRKNLQIIAVQFVSGMRLPLRPCNCAK
jgi:hypothetical protein